MYKKNIEQNEKGLFLINISPVKIVIEVSTCMFWVNIMTGSYLCNDVNLNGIVCGCIIYGLRALVSDRHKFYECLEQPYSASLAVFCDLIHLVFTNVCRLMLPKQWRQT